MLARKMAARLEAWRAAQGERPKAFLLSGARQTGKTFTVREFARQHYANYIEVNFLDNEDAASLLTAAQDSDELVTRLSLLSKQPLDAGRTLVFFDEIQASPDMLTVAKFLVEQDRFDLVLSGSLLGVELRGIRSFPVGYLHEERMYPLDFEEFCWALQVPARVIDEIRAAYRDKRPLEVALHDRLVRLYRLFIVVGGMPEVVQRFIDSKNDLAAVREVQSDIVSQYGADIIRYANGRSLFVEAIYQALPGELAKVNKRFVLGSLKQGATYARFEDDFEWLAGAGVALPTCLATEPSRPLRRSLERRKFKLYSSDVGLLMVRYPNVIAMDVIEGSRSVNFGAVYENAVAQELKSAGYELCYYNNNRKGEVDFLIETGAGSIIPIEVKSGKDYKLHTALNNLLGTQEYAIDEAYVLSEHNVSREERLGKSVYYLPLYMTLCLGSELEVATKPDDFAPPSFVDWA